MKYVAAFLPTVYKLDIDWFTFDGKVENTLTTEFILDLVTDTIEFQLDLYELIIELIELEIPLFIEFIFWFTLVCICPIALVDVELIERHFELKMFPT